ncbi:MAG: phosphatase PAP2 family protein [Aeromicrobium sp.]|uniref:phosphatase PAP2 family protein n=1 Tax=Aeromicrobium sp. TaxID=1871063 RepID=UPI0025BE7CDF|nr:phosphatase PAP2 family protein [Aeromicrobium sp.]MCK5891688.1 phosphatase PAP2 family protein [Aeromicrobium sp.]MDF1705808.1 phosphatase PAP2 family protein [Aeromicrobium sp.]
MSMTDTGTIREPQARATTSVRSRALFVTLLAAIGVAGVTAAALWTAGGQDLDQSAMNTVTAGRDTQLAVLSVLGYVSIAAVAIVAAVAVLLALLRGEVRLAVAALVVIGGANLTTQVLKHVVLERAEFAGGIVAHNSLPSGHTTVIAAALGALCLVSPAWLRPVVLTAGSFAVALTGASTVVAGWHRPADVLAAVLVCLAWTAGTALVVGGAVRRATGGLTFAVLGSGAALIFLIVIGVRPTDGWDGFLVSGAVLGSVALVTAVSAALMDRVSPSR